MAELIDRDALMAYPIRIDHYDKTHGSEDFVLGIESVLEYAKALPTIEAVPVVHGRWVPSEKHKPWLTCSECEDCYVDGEWIDGRKWSYCPNCGAKMDMEDKP